MYNPIVVPLDGSELAEEALPLATELAVRWHEPLHLVLVHTGQPVFLSPESGPAGLVELEEEVRQSLKAYLNRTAARVSESSGATAVPVLLEGPVVQSLSRYATNQVARLVVMTTHGRGGLSRLFLGSVADRLIRHLRCPAILATHGAGIMRTLEPGARRRVVIPLDGSRLAESIIDRVLAVYPPREVTLGLVSVVPAPSLSATPMGQAMWHPGIVEDSVAAANDYLGSVRDRLRELGVEATIDVLVDEQVASAVLRFADERKADLVAVATRGIAGLERAVIGSVADKVVRSVHLPVLVWNPLPGARSLILGDGVTTTKEPALAHPEL